jgi:hypothetical protein
LLRLVPIVMGVIVGVGATALAALLARRWRDRKTSAARAMPPIRQKMVRAASPLPQARRPDALPSETAGELPGGLHLLFHGVSLEDIAAILSRQTLPGPEVNRPGSPRPITDRGSPQAMGAVDGGRTPGSHRPLGTTSLRPGTGTIPAPGLRGSERYARPPGVTARLLGLCLAFMSAVARLMPRLVPGRAAARRLAVHHQVPRAVLPLSLCRGALARHPPDDDPPGRPRVAVLACQRIAPPRWPLHVHATIRTQIRT